MKHHILVENLAGYHAVRRLIPEGEGIVWYTSSPFLLERLSQEGSRVWSVEDLVSQEELNALGKCAWGVTLRWERQLDDSAASRECGLQLGRAVSSQLKLMLVPILVRALIAERWITETLAQPSAVACVVGNDRVSPVAADFMRFRDADTLFAVLLAQSSWNAHIRLIEPERSASIDRQHTSASRRVRFLLRLFPWLNASWSKICFSAWRRYGRWMPHGVRREADTTEVLLFRANELIKESFLTLLRRKVQLTPLELPKVPRAISPTGGSDAAGADASLTESLREILLEVVTRAGFQGDCLRVAATVAAERVSQWIPVFTTYARSVRASLSRVLGPSAHPRVVLTHCLTDPAERLFYQLQQEAGIPVVAVQHGAAGGLTQIHEWIADLSDMTACQAYVDYNEKSCEFYHRWLKDKMPPTLVGGAPRITRSDRWPHLSRALARRLLGLRANERVVMFVANAFYGNDVTLPNGHLDTHYYAYVRRVVYDVFARLPATCVVKLYPKPEQVTPHPFAACGDLPSNVRVVQYPDFRYLRAAADVIVLDVPYNTLAWALGAGVPTIFLDLPFNPLLPGVVPRVEASLFRIDGRQPGWERRLQGLLQLPHGALQREWQRKASSRAMFAAQYLFGPPDARIERIVEFALGFAKPRHATSASETQELAECLEQV